MAILGFLAVVLLVITAIHLYLWKRLVRDTTVAKTRARRAGGVTILLLAVALPGTFIGARSGPDWLALGYLWVPLMFYLLLTLLALEIPVLAVRLWLRGRANRAARDTAGRAVERVGTEPAVPAPEPALVTAGDSGPGAEPAGTDLTTEHGPRIPGEAGTGAPGGATAGAVGATARPPAGPYGDPYHDPRRRLLLARGAAIFAGLTAAGITGYGVRTALGPPSVDRVRVPLAKLPRGMDGFRIAVVSDIHLGPFAGRSHAQRVVDVINGLDADLVTIVGDLVDGPVAELGRAAEPLRGLHSRNGVFFVTGNHEYYSGVDEWLAELPRLGIRALRNERLEIGGLDLAGVDDVTGGEPGVTAGQDGPDYAAALGDRDPARPVVLMAHQPVQAREAARYGVDLQVSGHTHGGQMMPFNLIVRAQQPMVSGLGKIDDTVVYVTNGAGFWGPPVRVGAVPQVGLAQLQSPR